jgi:hypothetical protein
MDERIQEVLRLIDIQLATVPDNCYLLTHLDTSHLSEVPARML